MSGIAEVLLTLGYKVTGSDLAYSDTVRRLEELGGKILDGHQESNVGDAQVVVISFRCLPGQSGGARGARQTDPRHSSSRDALQNHAAQIWRGDRRGAWEDHDDVDGGHGPGAGGTRPHDGDRREINALGSHARLGRGDLLVAEADESDGSFLKLSPSIVAVADLDRETSGPLRDDGTGRRQLCGIHQPCSILRIGGIVRRRRSSAGAVAACREALSNVWSARRLLEARHLIFAPPT